MHRFESVARRLLPFSTWDMIFEAAAKEAIGKKQSVEEILPVQQLAQHLKVVRQQE